MTEAKAEYTLDEYQARQSNVKRGKAAYDYGKRTEDALDKALDAYQAQGGLLTWIATYPKIIVKNGKPLITGKAPPDRIITLRPHGRALWLECKHTKRSKTLTIGKRSTHQYDYLYGNMMVGGLAGYIVYWVKHQAWRYHPVQSVDDSQYPFSVKLHHTDGLPVPGYGGQVHLGVEDHPDLELPEPQFLDIAVEAGPQPLGASPPR